MPARFVDRQVVASLDQLTPVQQAQLAHAGKLWDGEDRPAAFRLSGDEPEAVEGSFLGFCELWKVVDGDRHLYDAWIYMVDSGAFFRANTTEEVAGIIQFGLECSDPAIRKELGMAMVAGKFLPPSDLSYAEFSKLLADE